MSAILFQEHSRQGLQELGRKTRTRDQTKFSPVKAENPYFFPRNISQPIYGWMPAHLKAFATILHYYKYKKTVSLLTLPTLCVCFEKFGST